jgi:hypothetical protein
MVRPMGNLEAESMFLLSRCFKIYDKLQEGEKEIPTQ